MRAALETALETFWQALLRGCAGAELRELLRAQCPVLPGEGETQ